MRAFNVDVIVGMTRLYAGARRRKSDVFASARVDECRFRENASSCDAGAGFVVSAANAVVFPVFVRGRGGAGVVFVPLMYSARGSTSSESPSWRRMPPCVLIDEGDQALTMPAPKLQARRTASIRLKRCRPCDTSPHDEISRRRRIAARAARFHEDTREVPLFLKCGMGSVRLTALAFYLSIVSIQAPACQHRGRCIAF